MRKAEEPGSLASHQRSNRTKLPLFILLEGSSLWLLPAGRSDSGQILHPQPVAVASHRCPPAEHLCRSSGRGREQIGCKAAPDVLVELCRSRGLPCSAHSGQGSLEPFPPSVDLSGVCFQPSQDDSGSFRGSVTYSTVSLPSPQASCPSLGTRCSCWWPIGRGPC